MCRPERLTQLTTTRYIAAIAGASTVCALAAPGGCVSQPATHRVCTVYAASSLTDALTALSDEFRRTHPDYQLRMQFAGSNVLRSQIELGATPDVFMSANAPHAEALSRAGLMAHEQTVATTRLVLVVDQASDIRSVWDLAGAGVAIVLGERSCPLGSYTDALVAQADAERPGFGDAVRARTVSRELNARLAAAKISLGQADAAFLYAPDARNLSGVRVIELPDAWQPHVRYVAVHAESECARDWRRFLSSEHALSVLRAEGFEAPE